ncbi:MAG: BON domain-containing protein [Chromatiaceae bacterium]
MPNELFFRPDPLDRPSRSRPGPQPLIAFLALSLALPLLEGCAAALIGAGVGAAVGATVMVRDRRGQDAVIDDKEIEFKSRDWPGAQTRCQVAVNSYNRLVLLTGQCKDEAAAKAYAERVSKVPKVSRVVDEITIGPLASMNRQSEDTLITSRAKLSLVNVDIKGFDPTRVTVITESGIVYLMGMVTNEEAEAAVEQVRYVPGVVKVVKIFEITNPSPAADAQATAAPVPSTTASPGLPEETGGTLEESP